MAIKSHGKKVIGCSSADNLLCAIHFCSGYLAPDKIDNKFFDPKHAFKEVEVQAKTVKELVPLKKAKVCVGGNVFVILFLVFSPC